MAEAVDSTKDGEGVANKPLDDQRTTTEEHSRGWCRIQIQYSLFQINS